MINIKRTPKRHLLLYQASLKIDYPGTENTRLAMEEYGCIQCTIPPANYFRGITLIKNDQLIWEITGKGLRVLEEWNIEYGHVT